MAGAVSPGISKDCHDPLSEEYAELTVPSVAPELSFQYPQLTMAQIHSALAFYWDNQQQLDEDIKRRTETAEALRSAARQSTLARRLAAEKHH